MKKLLKANNFNSDMEYYQYIVDSFLNGQFEQAYNLFDVLPLKNKMQLLKALTVGNWNSGLALHKIANLFDRV